MKKLLHQIKHFFVGGYFDHEKIDGKWYLGLRCPDCNELISKQLSLIQEK